MIIRPATESDDSQLIAIHNRINADQPPMSVEEYRDWLDTAPKSQDSSGPIRYVAEDAGSIVAFFALIKDRRGNRGSYDAVLQVDPAQQGSGIGSELYDVLERRSKECGVETLHAEAREDQPSALRFATRRGFEFTGRVERSARLEVGKANREAFTGLEKKLQREGIRIESLAEILLKRGEASDQAREAFLRDLYSMAESTMRDIPGRAEFDSMPYDLWLRRLEGPGRSEEWYWVAIAGGKPVGEARLTLRGEHAAWNGYTGVDREYRGRGVAQALKLHTVEWARKRGIDFLYTGNDAENHPMLAINQRLGYQSLPGEIQLVKQRSR